MSRQDSYNILMYSHDTYGLGHIRRTMAIAWRLLDQDVNILILTGSPVVGRFDFPERIDFVRMPGMIKQGDDVYVPHSIKINPGRAMLIRQSIIAATALAFEPDLVIVDKAPLGLKKEILPALRWLKDHRPQTRLILGLRDIMDDAESTRRDWREKGIYDALRDLYSEIWVYGERGVYDPVREYDIPDDVAAKMIFTGYIPRPTPKNGVSLKEMAPDIAVNGNGGSGGGGQAKSGCGCREKVVLVTAGGGGDGYPMMDAFLKALESCPEPPFRAVLVSGPFMPVEERQDLARRAKQVKARFHHFYRRMERLLAVADVVVSMGGYNTFCEILSHARPALIIPRESPRLEQRIRAEAFKARGMIELLPWDEMRPERVLEMVNKLLAAPEGYVQAMRGFSMTGYQVMRQRLAVFKAEQPSGAGGADADGAMRAP